MAEEVQGRRRKGFFDLLKSLEADVEEIIVVVKSGGSCDSGKGKSFCCCKHEGILCNVTSNFIVLIGDNKKIFIPIDSIAAIIKKDC